MLHSVALVYTLDHPLPYLHSFAQANNVWTMTMDRDILEWATQRPVDWWPYSDAKVYTWGQGSYCQLGHSNGEMVVSPEPVPEWKDMQQVNYVGGLGAWFGGKVLACH
jgi:hypothetical protein